MLQPVSSKVSFPQIEEKILGFWKENHIFERSVEARRGSPRGRFTLYEGPPTANGNPGIHHVLTRVFKDALPRYKTMKGFYAPRQAGWDTHGLPVELEVEKELGLHSKAQIEQFGVAEFNARCRQSVFRYLKEWRAMTERIGYWVDLDHPYITLENSYIESGWWLIKQLWDKGLIYQGFKVTPHCPRCGTSLSSHEVALGYKDDTKDPSVFIRLTLLDESNQPRQLTEVAKKLQLGLNLPTFALIWTTTPWTLPANAAAAVAPDAIYILAQVENGKNSERLLLAKDLAQAVLGAEGWHHDSQGNRTGWVTVATIRGADVIGLRYQPLFDVKCEPVSAYRIIGGDFVSLDEGTGIVHIAPAYGEIDLEVGRAENLPTMHTVDLKGNVEGNLPGAGLFVKAADPIITEDLKKRGLLYRAGTITHTYPFCWRCDTPLLYYAKTAWYIQTTAKKKELIENNEKINWYPDYIKHGRFGDWLENNVDWAFSRERYWGTPLPLWRCTEGHLECVGGLAELKEKPGLTGLEEPLDLHRPYVDKITFHCSQCQKEMKRLPEVIDCWFDSGAMPVAQWHYPFENRDEFQSTFPADFICEAIDQTRGWFYSLHAISTLIFDRPSYRNVICLGHVLDTKGEKMSKAKGNVIDPKVVLDKFGADALRWYLLTSSPPGNVRRFDTEQVAELLRQFLLTLWNTYSFFVTYANIDRYQPGSPPGERSELDRWLLSELNRLIAQVTQDLDDYNPTNAGRKIEVFVDNLSNWYVRRSRRRFWKSENDADKLAAYDTLYRTLVTLSKLLAPLAPFIAEEIYQNLVRSVDPKAPESVHLTNFPEADKSLVDEKLSLGMHAVMATVSLARSARESAQIKVRQPIPSVSIWVANAALQKFLEDNRELVLEEVNAKHLEVFDLSNKTKRTSLKKYITFQNSLNLRICGPRLKENAPAFEARLKSLDAFEVGMKLMEGQAIAIDEERFSAAEITSQAMGKDSYMAKGVWRHIAVIDTQLTPELISEGKAREIVHRLQTMRRKAGFDIADYIVTYYQGEASLREVMKSSTDYIKQETLSRELVEDTLPSDAYTETQRIDGQEIVLGVKRLG